MWRTNSDPRQVLRYWRDSGAICFELPLLGPYGRSPQDFVEQLLQSDLEWLWISETRPLDRNHPDDVAARALTRLRASTAHSLIADFSERDPDGYGRFVALFGIQNVPETLESRWMREELKRLIGEQDGALRLVVLQIGDTPNEYVYVRRNPSGGAARMLQQWGVGEAGPFKEKKYRALRAVALEKVFRLDPNDEGKEYVGHFEL